MPFYTAESDTAGNIQSGTITQLNPGPTWVEYPDKFDNEVRYSKDGNSIIQSPLKDSRPRAWVWRRYRQSISKYVSLYNLLLNLQYRNRITSPAAKSPWIYVKDTETNNLTYRQWNGTKWIESEDWVRVKVTQVTQQIAAQGGQAVYDETKFTWVIDDPRWNFF